MPTVNGEIKEKVKKSVQYFVKSKATDFLCSDIELLRLVLNILYMVRSF